MDIDTEVDISDRQQQFLDFLAELTAKDERCPSQRVLHDMGFSEALVRSCAQNGLIIVHMYTQNWRVIEIHHGDHKGETTQTPSDGRKHVYHIDKDGNSNAKHYRTTAHISMIDPPEWETDIELDPEALKLAATVAHKL